MKAEASSRVLARVLLPLHQVKERQRTARKKVFGKNQTNVLNAQ